jgi:hypothetical protein
VRSGYSVNLAGRYSRMLDTITACARSTPPSGRVAVPASSCGSYERPNRTFKGGKGLLACPTNAGRHRPETASYESEANMITDWSISVVPGLLQTYEYATAYMLALGLPLAPIGSAVPLGARKYASHG